jgi:hypothetical protein
MKQHRLVQTQALRTNTQTQAVSVLLHVDFRRLWSTMVI